MSWLSSIGSAIKSTAFKVLSPVVNNQSNPIHQTLDTLQTALTHPIKTVTTVTSGKSLKPLVAETTSGSMGKQIGGVVLGTVAIGSTVAGAGAVAGAAKAGTLGTSALNIAKNLIPKTLGGKVAGTAGAIVAVNAVANNPTGSIQTLGKSYDALADFGKAASEPLKGDTIQENSEDVKDRIVNYAKEHPYATAAEVLLALGLTGFSIAYVSNILSNYSNTKAIEKNTDILSNPPTVPNIDIPSTSSQPIINVYYPDNSLSQITQQQTAVEAATLAPVTASTAAISQPLTEAKSLTSEPVIKKSKAKKKAKKKKTTKKAKKKKTTKKAKKKKTTKKKKKKSIKRSKS